MGPDTACSVSAWSTAKHTGNNTEGWVADLALGKWWRILLEWGPRSLQANGINGSFLIGMWLRARVC